MLPLCLWHAQLANHVEMWMWDSSHCQYTCQDDPVQRLLFACVCMCERETDRKGAAERSVTAFSGCKRGRRARQKPQIKLHTILKETLAEVGEILFKSLSLRVHWHNTCSLKTFNYPLSRAVVSEYKLPL